MLLSLWKRPLPLKRRLSSKRRTGCPIPNSPIARPILPWQKTHAPISLYSCAPTARAQSLCCGAEPSLTRGQIRQTRRVQCAVDYVFTHHNVLGNKVRNWQIVLQKSVED